MTTAAIPLTAGAVVPGPEATRKARLDALAALGAAGWPTRKREPWRYTNLEPLASAGFELSPPTASEPVLAAARALLGDPSFGAPEQQLVLLDGQRVDGLGATAIDGVEIVDLEQRWNEFVRRFAGQLAANHYPLAALNTAFGRRGLWLRVPAQTVVAAPIHLVVAGARPQLAAQPRIVIDVETGARVTFVQHFVDCDPETQSWTNHVLQLKQAEHSRVALYRLQRHALTAAHTSLLAADLAASAELTAGYFDLGARLARNDVAIALGGPGARTDLFGLLLAGRGQHIDDHTVIRHAAGATVSRENFRGIIGERGHGVFSGKVIVEPGCQRIDAQLNNDNLLLGEHGEIDTKPELEIYAHDVKCSHGATVGELDAEQLFYLRARGLDLVAARRVLTAAFATTIVEQIGDEQLRAAASALVAERLATLAEQ